MAVHLLAWSPIEEVLNQLTSIMKLHQNNENLWIFLHENMYELHYITKYFEK